MIQAMAIPARLLTDGEHVVVSTRTHVKVLLGPLAVLLATVFATVFAAAQATRRATSEVALLLELAIAILAVLVLLRYVARPFLAWYTTTYTFTNRRFVTRSGFLAKHGRTVPLNRITGVDYEIGVVDRLLGCGTLIVADASEHGRIPLRDIPHVEEVQTRLAEELHRIGALHGSGDGT
jgi:uncharacterized membrane protein YdbT with pleckstrin-like domain